MEEISKELRTGLLGKSDLIGTLEVHANSLRLASVFRVLARSSDLAATFRPLVASTRLTAFQPLITLLEDNARLIHSADQLYFTVVRSAVTESLDLTRDYCRSTNQTALLKSQPWFHMFRIFRNAPNHNFRLEFKLDDLKMLPLSWKTLTIKATHNLQELTQGHLPPSAAIDWMADLDDFASTQLT